MTRKLLKLPFAGFFLAPLGAFGLGLGQIDVQSGLNQPLNAQIELLSATQDELSTISVDLASPQVFAQAGVDRLALLSGLQFTVQTRSNGDSYIHVSSRQPIREPLLNFLVEVDWAQGRLVREFVVLLEPPGTAVARSVPAPAPVRSTPPRPVEPLPEPAPPSPAPRLPAAPLAAKQLSGEIYGPVARGETLWAIASRLRPDTTVSMQEMMRSIVQANPHAFVNGDGNRLLAGTTLQIPEALGGQTTPAPGPETAEPSAPRLAAELPAQPPTVRLVSPDPEEVPEEQRPAAVQTIDTAEAPGVAGPAFPSPFVIELENSHPELQVAGLDDLRARIDQLVGVDEAALSAIQARQISEPEPLEGTPEEIAPEAPEAEASVPAPDTTATDEVEPVASETADATTSQGTEQPESAPQPPVVPAETVPAREPGLMDRLLAFRDNPMMLAWIALGALLITALMVLAARALRKRSVEEQKEEAEEMDFEPIVASDQPAPVSAGMGASPSLAKPKPQPAATPSRPAVSPLERVDLLLAVGNYREAENTVRTALDKNPDDIALALKLLDVHYAANNAQGFLEQAEMLRGRLADGADPRWEQVKRRGQDLCPGHPLFAEPEKSELAETKFEEKEKKSPGLEEGLEFDISPQPDRLKKASPASSEEDTLLIPDEDETLSQPFFDLGKESSTPKAHKPTAAKPEESKKPRDLDAELESLDFDFDEETGGIRTERIKEMKGAELEYEEKSDELESELKDLNFEFDQIPVQDHNVEGELKLPRLEGGTDREIGETMEEIGSDDYVETKLDLAVAYIDMDDKVGARSLLDEVLQEGSSEQKKRAEELLQNLS